MEELKNKIKKLAEAYAKEITGIRRHLHMYPELSGEEYKTSDYICSMLKEFGIEYKQGIAKTGVLGIIIGSVKEGGKSKQRAVALRADMDALPIEEMNDIDYKSKNHGAMHACGHDVHMASLLGAAKILHELRGEFSGTVKLMFQPSEETYPGGAMQMIKEGVLENPKVDAVIGQHTLPELEAGTIGVKNGSFMASTDEIFVTVKGKGGHAAIPDKNIDAILIASHIIVALQQIVSRNANPNMPTVVSFGKISCAGRSNVMPDEVRIEGTMRTYSEEWRKEIYARINRISKSIAEGMGGSCDISIIPGYPSLVNDDELTDRLRINAKSYLGGENVVELDRRMTAEDFSYFAQNAPSCFYRLGVANKEKGIISGLHTATFNVDEKSLETGMGLMAWLTLKELNSEG